MTDESRTHTVQNHNLRHYHYATVTIVWCSVLGINDLVDANALKVENGMKAYGLLQKIRAGNSSPDVLSAFKTYQNDLGYGLLLSSYTDDVAHATTTQIQAAARATIPTVWALFYTFRIMVAAGFVLILLFMVSLALVWRRTAWKSRTLWYAALYSIPLPWICVLCGWFVTEHGRQPWTVFGVLPTLASSSSLSLMDLCISLVVFLVLFISLTLVEVYLMFKFARLGPSSLHLGKYDLEQK